MTANPNLTDPDAFTFERLASPGDENTWSTRAAWTVRSGTYVVRTFGAEVHEFRYGKHREVFVEVRHGIFNDERDRKYPGQAGARSRPLVPATHRRADDWHTFAKFVCAGPTAHTYTLLPSAAVPRFAEILSEWVAEIGYPDMVPIRPR